VCLVVVVAATGEAEVQVLVDLEVEMGHMFCQIVMIVGVDQATMAEEVAEEAGIEEMLIEDLDLLDQKI